MTFLSVDTRYIFARDNYTCCACGAEIPDYSCRFTTIVDNKEFITSNLVTICPTCHFAKNPITKFPLKTPSGRLIVVIGPMYASKSTITKSLLNKYRRAYNSFVWVKPTTDDRAEGFSLTHDQEKIEALTINQDRPDLYLKQLKKFEIIAIDEVQFFSDRILYVVHELLRDSPRIVVVNGLKLTASRSLFGVLHYLMAEADDILCLKAVCNVCRQIDSASRTKSFRVLSAVSTGGTEDYYAICASCDGSENERKFLEAVVSR